DSLSTCFIEGEGEAIVLIHGGGADGAGDAGREVTERLAFTEHFRCPKHPEIEFFEPTPKLFSFNNPYGSCPVCTGFGSTLDYDVDLIVPNDARSIDEGAVDPWSKPRYHRERAKLRSFTLEQNASVYSPWAELPEDFREAVLYGAEGFKGVIPFLVSRERKRYKHYIRVFLRQYQSPQVCRACGGARIQPGALYIKIGTSTISDVNRLPIEDVQGWVGGLELSEMEARIAETILRSCTPASPSWSTWVSGTLPWTGRCGRSPGVRPSASTSRTLWALDWWIRCMFSMSRPWGCTRRTRRPSWPFWDNCATRGTPWW
ncbi:MAG: hypothetical protein VYB51_01820, partial [Gemmatimonadota bacterium]|nr:hypothetical protein [Gemmatimonadota bacterium]